MSKEVTAFAVGIGLFFGLGHIGQELVGPVVCEDGWRSSSIGKQGACSHHGGVDDDLQKVVGVVSFTSGVVGGIYSYAVMNRFADRRRKKKDAAEAIIYEEVHKNDPHCPRHSDERMIHRKGKYGDFWGCPRYPRCKKTKKFIVSSQGL